MNAHQKERDVPRHPRRVRIELEGRPGVTFDVSMGGFGAEVVHVPRRGSTVHGSIEMDHQSFTFVGLVIWVQDGEPGGSRYSRVGIRFRGVENAYFQALTSAERALAGC